MRMIKSGCRKWTEGGMIPIQPMKKGHIIIDGVLGIEKGICENVLHLVSRSSRQRLPEMLVIGV
jgi:hypothetical protein